MIHYINEKRVEKISSEFVLDSEKILSKKDKYILDENNNIIPATLLEWGTWLEENRRTGKQIVKQEIINNLKVSTIFLGLDHNLLGNELHIFETMIFDEKEPLDYIERYASWIKAEEGHKKAVQWVLDGCKEEDLA